MKSSVDARFRVSVSATFFLAFSLIEKTSVSFFSSFSLAFSFFADVVEVVASCDSVLPPNTIDLRFLRKSKVDAAGEVARGEAVGVEVELETGETGADIEDVGSETGEVAGEIGAEVGAPREKNDFQEEGTLCILKKY